MSPFDRCSSSAIAGRVVVIIPHRIVPEMVSQARILESSFPVRLYINNFSDYILQYNIFFQKTQKFRFSQRY